jgi:hypothetical protein
MDSVIEQILAEYERRSADEAKIMWKDLYIPCLELFHPKLSPGALVAGDNRLFPLNTPRCP